MKINESMELLKDDLKKVLDYRGVGLSKCASLTKKA
jgi:hypothetical protein